MDPDVLKRKPARQVLDWLTYSAARSIAAEDARAEAEWRAARAATGG